MFVCKLVFKNLTNYSLVWCIRVRFRIAAHLQHSIYVSKYGWILHWRRFTSRISRSLQYYATFSRCIDRQHGFFSTRQECNGSFGITVRSFSKLLSWFNISILLFLMQQNLRYCLHYQYVFEYKSKSKHFMQKFIKRTTLMDVIKFKLFYPIEIVILKCAVIWTNFFNHFLFCCCSYWITYIVKLI